MKKLSTLLVLAAMLSANAVQAQPTQNTPRPAPVAQSSSNDDFCWGIGLVGLAVISTIVGLTAASASSSPNSYSN